VQTIVTVQIGASADRKKDYETAFLLNHLETMSSMDAYACVVTKLDIREFSSNTVPNDIKLKILQAARLTASGMNVQHWRFVLVQDRDQLKVLAEDSTTGAWIGRSNFAVIVLTNPRYPFHLIDAGRAVQDMQLVAWNYGVASGVYTGVKQEALRSHFNIPKEMNPSMIVGFGYPARKVSGKRKNRKPLGDIVFLGKYDNRLDPESFGA
jgi:nitroreductase